MPQQTHQSSSQKRKRISFHQKLNSPQYFQYNIAQNMKQQDSPTLTTQTKPNWHRLSNKPVFMKYLNAKKLYSCECGDYSRKFSFSRIKQHAKKIHNVLIDESPNNYIIELFGAVEIYIYSLNPRPQILFPNRPPREVQKSTNKITKLRRLIDCYRDYLKAYDKRLDLEVITHFRSYIRTISSKITDDPQVSEDPINYFNEFIMNAPFLKEKSEENGLQSDQKDLIMRQTESLRRFWIYLKKKQKTNLELELRQEFVSLLQHQEQ